MHYYLSHIYFHLEEIIRKNFNISESNIINVAKCISPSQFHLVLGTFIQHRLHLCIWEGTVGQLILWLIHLLFSGLRKNVLRSFHNLTNIIVI
jgi:hypothetical protein